MNKPHIYWILQANQTTPYIIDFLELIAHRTHEFMNLKFLIPDVDTNSLKDSKKLKPIVFQASSSITPDSYEGYNRKRNLLGNDDFSEGLAFYQPLLLDDLGGGNIQITNIHPPADTLPKAVVLQIPTPLGSSESEERLFYAWTHWGKANKVPVIGYELLPLDTRWTLAPSLMDGIITMRRDSFEYLTNEHAHLDQTIWLTPKFEGQLFSPATVPFWRNGMGAHYSFQSDINLDFKKTVLYLPHNVAMTHEFKKILEHLSCFSDDIHIMFPVGKDQVRGAHSHREIIEIVCHKELSAISHSFHDMNKPYDMTAADGLVATSNCYGSVVSATNGIPSIIFDPVLSPHSTGHIQRVATVEQLREAVSVLIQHHQQETELSRILFQLANRRDHE
jgi:hypothetical protein